MGYAYLEDSDDTRNSPSADLVETLKEKVGQLVIHDPYVHRYQGDLLEGARGCDAVVVMVKHREYRSVELKKLGEGMRTRLLLDGRAVYGKQQAVAAGFKYWGIGIANGE
jgi:UDP-N-acetyl-D-mannosaminuronic acid dehydrogenase